MKIILLVIFVWGSRSFADVETKEFDSSQLNELHLQNSVGKSLVESTDATKATVIALQRSSSTGCKLNSTSTGSVLNVGVEGHGMFSAPCEVEFKVQVPKKMKLDLTSESGAISVFNVVGPLKFQSGSGNVFATGTFTSVDGVVGTGNVHVDGLNGGGSIKTESGSIDLTMAANPAEKAALNIQTSEGNVTMRLPEQMKISTNFQSATGKMTNPFGNTPDASFQLSVQSSGGNLNLDKQ